MTPKDPSSSTLKDLMRLFGISPVAPEEEEEGSDAVSAPGCEDKANPELGGRKASVMLNRLIGVLAAGGDLSEKASREFVRLPNGQFGEDPGGVAEFQARQAAERDERRAEREAKRAASQQAASKKPAAQSASKRADGKQAASKKPAPKITPEEVKPKAPASKDTKYQASVRKEVESLVDPAERLAILKEEAAVEKQEDGKGQIAAMLADEKQRQAEAAQPGAMSGDIVDVGSAPGPRQTPESLARQREAMANITAVSAGAPSSGSATVIGSSQTSAANDSYFSTQGRIADDYPKEELPGYWERNPYEKFPGETDDEFGQRLEDQVNDEHVLAWDAKEAAARSSAPAINPDEMIKPLADVPYVRANPEQLIRDQAQAEVDLDPFTAPSDAKLPPLTPEEVHDAAITAALDGPPEQAREAISRATAEYRQAKQEFDADYSATPEGRPDPAALAAGVTPEKLDAEMTAQEADDLAASPPVVVADVVSSQLSAASEYAARAAAGNPMSKEELSAAGLSSAGIPTNDEAFLRWDMEGQSPEDRIAGLEHEAEMQETFGSGTDTAAHRLLAEERAAQGIVSPDSAPIEPNPREDARDAELAARLASGAISQRDYDNAMAAGASIRAGTNTADIPKDPEEFLRWDMEGQSPEERIARLEHEVEMNTTFGGDPGVAGKLLEEELAKQAAPESAGAAIGAASAAAALAGAGAGTAFAMSPEEAASAHYSPDGKPLYGDELRDSMKDESPRYRADVFGIERDKEETFGDGGDGTNARILAQEQLLQMNGKEPTPAEVYDHTIADLDARKFRDEITNAQYEKFAANAAKQFSTADPDTAEARDAFLEPGSERDRVASATAPTVVGRIEPDGSLTTRDKFSAPEEERASLAERSPAALADSDAISPDDEDFIQEQYDSLSAPSMEAFGGDRAAAVRAELEGAIEATAGTPREAEFRADLDRFNALVPESSAAEAAPAASDALARWQALPVRVPDETPQEMNARINERDSLRKEVIASQTPEERAANSAAYDAAQQAHSDVWLHGDRNDPNYAANVAASQAKLDATIQAIGPVEGFNERQEREDAASGYVPPTTTPRGIAYATAEDYNADGELKDPARAAASAAQWDQRPGESADDHEWRISQYAGLSAPATSALPDNYDEALRLDLEGAIENSGSADPELVAELQADLDRLNRISPPATVVAESGPGSVPTFDGDLSKWGETPSEIRSNLGIAREMDGMSDEDHAAAMLALQAQSPASEPGVARFDGDLSKFGESPEEVAQNIEQAYEMGDLSAPDYAEARIANGNPLTPEALDAAGLTSAGIPKDPEEFMLWDTRDMSPEERLAYFQHESDMNASFGDGTPGVADRLLAEERAAQGVALAAADRAGEPLGDNHEEAMANRGISVTPQDRDFIQEQYDSLSAPSMEAFGEDRDAAVRAELEGAIEATAGTPREAEFRADLDRFNALRGPIPPAANVSGLSPQNEANVAFNADREPAAELQSDPNAKYQAAVTAAMEKYPTDPEAYRAAVQTAQEELRYAQTLDKPENRPLSETAPEVDARPSEAEAVASKQVPEPKLDSTLSPGQQKQDAMKRFYEERAAIDLKDPNYMDLLKQNSDKFDREFRAIDAAADSPEAVAATASAPKVIALQNTYDAAIKQLDVAAPDFADKRDALSVQLNKDIAAARGEAPAPSAATASPGQPPLSPEDEVRILKDGAEAERASQLAMARRLSASADPADQSMAREIAARVRASDAGNVIGPDGVEEMSPERQAAGIQTMKDQIAKDYQAAVKQAEDTHWGDPEGYRAAVQAAQEQARSRDAETADAAIASTPVLDVPPGTAPASRPVTNSSGELATFLPTDAARKDALANLEADRNAGHITDAQYSAIRTTIDSTPDGEVYPGSYASKLGLIDSETARMAAESDLSSGAERDLETERIAAISDRDQEAAQRSGVDTVTYPQDTFDSMTDDELVNGKQELAQRMASLAGADPSLAEQYIADTEAITAEQARRRASERENFEDLTLGTGFDRTAETAPTAAENAHDDEMANLREQRAAGTLSQSQYQQAAMESQARLDATRTPSPSVATEAGIRSEYSAQLRTLAAPGGSLSQDPIALQKERERVYDEANAAAAAAGLPALYDATPEERAGARNRAIALAESKFPDSMNNHTEGDPFDVLSGAEPDAPENPQVQAAFRAEEAYGARLEQIRSDRDASYAAIRSDTTLTPAERASALEQADKFYDDDYEQAVMERDAAEGPLTPRATALANALQNQEAIGSSAIGPVEARAAKFEADQLADYEARAAAAAEHFDNESQATRDAWEAQSMDRPRATPKTRLDESIEEVAKQVAETEKQAAAATGAEKERIEKNGRLDRRYVQAARQAQARAASEALRPGANHNAIAKRLEKELANLNKNRSALLQKYGYQPPEKALRSDAAYVVQLMSDYDANRAEILRTFTHRPSLQKALLDSLESDHFVTLAAALDSK